MVGKLEVIAGKKSAWGKCRPAECSAQADLPEARLWIASGLPTIPPVCWDQETIQCTTPQMYHFTESNAVKRFAAEGS
jgi:hypothetical protein